jgi:hypothetical protein
MLQGIVSLSAPVYNPSEKGLEFEGRVSALKASIASESTHMQHPEDDKRCEVREVPDTEVMKKSTPSLPYLPRARGVTEVLQPSVSSPAALCGSAIDAFTPRHGACFLSASAPGSRLPSAIHSPLPSRAVSPAPGGLRAIRSSLGLARLGSING